VQSYRSSGHVHTITYFLNEFFEMMQVQFPSTLAEILVYFNLFFEGSVDNLPCAKIKDFVDNINLTKGRNYALIFEVVPKHIH